MRLEDWDQELAMKVWREEEYQRGFEIGFKIGRDEIWDKVIAYLRKQYDPQTIADMTDIPVDEVLRLQGKQDYLDDPVGFMDITYDTKKDLPCDQLQQLFMLVGWSDGSETEEMIQHYNKPFINSTVVISAWKNERLIGCVRVLSDKMFRSVIYDLAVSPDYQNHGIGKELVSRCRAYFPDSEWLVETTNDKIDFYEKLGFTTDQNVFLSIPCKLFTCNQHDDES